MVSSLSEGQTFLMPDKAVAAWEAVTTAVATAVAAGVAADGAEEGVELGFGVVLYSSGSSTCTT